MAVQLIIAGLIAACAVTPPQQTSRKEALAMLERAQKLHAEGNYSRAIATYDSAAAGLPQIADWIGVFAASSASHLGDTAQVARRLSKVDADMAEWAWRSRARAYQKAGARTRAVQLARAATKSNRVSTRSDAWYMLVDLGETLTTRERVEAGRAHMRNGDVTVGLKELERALESGELSAASSAEVRYDVGRVLFNSGKYAQAVTQLERVPRGSAQRADARFLLGRALYRSGRQSDGMRQFREVAEVYSNSGAAVRALFFLGDLAQDEGKVSEAARYFERAINVSGRTDEGALAMMRLAAIAYAQKDYARAHRLYEEYRTRYPSGSYTGQATYWSAQSALKAGQTTKANALLRGLRENNPVSYYGMRAAHHLGDSALIAGLPAGPPANATAEKAVMPAVDRWELLRTVGWNEAAAFELARQKARITNNVPALYALAEELNKRDAPHLGIATGRDILNAGNKWDARLLRILYPMPYEQLIKRESRARGLDPYFVAALIRQESRFNKDARSGAGAIGLMQVMPATGRQLGKQAGITVTSESLTDPAINVKLGTRFLADLLRTYRRDDLALIAYNAGPTRASRWRGFPEFGTEELFIERIPFEETRDYVKIVTLNAAIYKSLYPAPVTGD